MSLTSTHEVWPVMLTPFTDTGAVDYASLERLIEWYAENGADGLFAVCQSSELFYLSLRERVRLTEFVKKKSRLPVIASGHIAEDAQDQADELRRIADAGADAVILITNRLAREGESSETWIANLDKLLGALDGKTVFGLYECPYPYKKLLTQKELEFCLSTGRFRFLKDTCCDIGLIRERLKLLGGSRFRLYNANTATLLDSLRAGAAGFSGVMANFHPELYAWLMRSFDQSPREAEILQGLLTVCSQIEKQLYPVNAKYFLQQRGVIASCYTRSKNRRELTPLYIDEINQMARLTEWAKETLGVTAETAAGRRV